MCRKAVLLFCVVPVVGIFITVFPCCKVLSPRVLDLVWTVLFVFLKFLRKDWPLELLPPFSTAVLEMRSVLNMLA